MEIRPAADVSAFQAEARNLAAEPSQVESGLREIVVVWGRGVCRAELDGIKRSMPYEVVASGADRVVVRTHCDLTGTDRLQHIHFTGEYYWVALSGGGLCEFFRKVPRSHHAN